ncbi:TetR/AcrR family transcriptional regulator [Propionimicrobium lymphophilum]|uniref:HTH tetR-type domain-containing protein n=2 Tax=Propionimicrobium TaxID=203133 RepID=S2WZZ3_9ACTN|nr:TetR/AcrR family transcriptional regulator [Propionimicrobium lymphophilum]EPD33254.1 hypothetical protein HMPREF9306_00786 [Propionimicrobium lymphophilum ACS-093-V-SCH5]MDK7710038.1 TetR/AcrR family transcriptional regulator [Propionimicrobium lymphophilum]MDK7732713.1 TetR/AcrR family transcriptional regulator [Propionimicrobium lymphophilum]
MPVSEPSRARRIKKRMTSAQRREQLIGIARGVFAQNGLDGTSVEEIAAAANVSKPVVYEHFGGKEGLYAVVVDREVQRLENAIHSALAEATTYRDTIEKGALALLSYIDEHTDGFRIINRDSLVAGNHGGFASILNDIVVRVEDLLIEPLARHGYDERLGPVFAQGLVGLVAMAGQRRLEDRSLSREDLARQVTNLAWNGLANLEKNDLAKPDQPEAGEED